jgi:hypothetical protein
MQEEVNLDSLLVHTQSVTECGLKGGRLKRCHRGGIRAVVEGVMGNKADGVVYAHWPGQRELFPYLEEDTRTSPLMVAVRTIIGQMKERQAQRFPRCTAWFFPQILLQYTVPY